MCTKTYYENGNLRIRSTYKDGFRDGPTEGYHENGQLQQKLTFIAGPLVFLAVAALACIIPARRAPGIHPAAALRGD